MRHRFAPLMMLALACAGCDSELATHDAGAPDDAATAPDAEPAPPDASPPTCATDVECDDGLFCNGAERCDPAAPGADARGCVFEGDVCPAGDVCDESADRCEMAPCEGDAERVTAYMDTDVDGYGHSARVMEVCPERVGPGTRWSLVADDCDDTRADVNPGATEVCDAAHIDEDCDPTTIHGGDGDADGDGYVSAACRNAAVGGDDCDDASADTHPGATEICDGADNDCDGMIDEGVLTTFHRDADGDGFGCDPAATTCPATVEACEAPMGYVADARDCNDDPSGGSAQNPTAAETCNGVDDDCDGAIDVGSAELGTREHCSACFDDCQFSCNAGVCEQAVDIDMHWDAQCAITTERNLYCWGRNHDGAVGNGTTAPANRPVRVLGTPTTAEVESMSLAGTTTCALTRNTGTGVGSVYCWGDNSEYQVADTGTTAVSVPILVGSGFEGVAVLSEQASPVGTTCAARHSGGTEVGLCWGARVPRRDGGGAWTYGSSRTPLELGPTYPSPVRSVVSGLPCTLGPTGRLTCWGDGRLGQRGDGTSTGSNAPSEVSLSSSVTQAVGSGGTRCALRGSEVWCWGSDGAGGLGDGPLSPDRCLEGSPSGAGCAFSPVRVTSLPPVERLFGDVGGFCARTSAGEMYCWGVDNRPGVELLPGEPTTGPTHSPTRVPSLDRFERLVMGRYGACGVETGGDVYCWGNGSSSFGTGARSGVVARVLPPAP
ncbi:MAG: MopE-related protein [Myxococcota bacterium]|nr:MopE-related protein [Myxococcota bacterium]